MALISNTVIEGHNAINYSNRGTSMISFVKGKTEISHNFPNCHR